MAAGPVSRILSAGLLRRDGHSYGLGIAAWLAIYPKAGRAEPARVPPLPQVQSLRSHSECRCTASNEGKK